MEQAVPCRECEDLERNYQRAVGHIKAVLRGNYSHLAERLKDLRHWQDRRDKAIRALYKHKQTHAGDRPGRANEDVA